MIKWLSKICGSIESLVFPPTCIICGQLQSEGRSFLCNLCFREIIFLRQIRKCEICSLPITEEEVQCQDCRQLNPKFDKLISIFLYDGIGAEIMKFIKFNGKYLLIHNFIEDIKEILSQYEFDTIVPIPSHIRKFISRGYNPSYSIATLISKLYSKPIVYALEKVKEKPSQLELSIEERLRNPSDAFKLSKKAKDTVAGKIILLVDDIATTGATLSSCANILKNEGGCKKVIAFSLARTPHIK